MSDKKFPLIMALIMAISPFAIDSYLPSFPDIAQHFSVGMDSVALTISLYIIGLALGQLFSGPLADRYHKSHLIIFGLAIFALSSLAIVFSSSFEYLQVARFTQGFGGGFSVVCVPALIRERATGNEAAKLFSLIGLIMVAAPAIAPLFGSVLMLIDGWQSIFYFLVLYATLVGCIAKVSIKDRPKVTHDKPKISVLRSYLAVLKNSKAMRYLLIQGLAFGILMIIIANASFIYQDYFGFDRFTFSLLFGANVVAMAVFNRINRLGLNSMPANVLLQKVLLMQLCACSVLLVLIYLQAPTAVLVVSIILMIGGQGAINPNTNAIYITHFDNNAGAASALLGASQFIIASLLSALSTVFYNGTLWPPMLMIFSISCIMSVLILLERKPQPEGLVATE